MKFTGTINVNDVDDFIRADDIITKILNTPTTAASKIEREFALNVWNQIFIKTESEGEEETLTESYEDNGGIRL